MRAKIFFSLLTLFSGFSAFSQLYSLSGKITDDKKNALPFAAVLVKGSGTGTNSNADGFYNIKLAPGTYEIIFQYVGFKKEIRTVEVKADIKMDIVMQSEAYELKEVVFKEGEDPAYAVIRQAIKKRKYYLAQVNSYTCKAYIKG
ncbi:MAG TPA: carboxypeptidase-like regulatory domain-containing protein, partial [Bacteroidia bacterium]|nr:carboxypeptidase-like regulatory domain-containing protein [Bacteroidia bacterium]